MSDILSGCQEARGMTTIEEIDCPRCGGVIEVFERDGLTVGDSVCEQCGCVIPGTYICPCILRRYQSENICLRKGRKREEHHRVAAGGKACSGRERGSDHRF